jgi:hypothetical protein
MTWKRFLMMTAVVYSLNGSLDSIINDNYGSTKANPNPYMIDYIINWGKPNYVPNFKLEWAMPASQTTNQATNSYDIHNK